MRLLSKEVFFTQDNFWGMTIGGMASVVSAAATRGGNIEMLHNPNINPSVKAIVLLTNIMGPFVFCFLLGLISGRSNLETKEREN